MTHAQFTFTDELLEVLLENGAHGKLATALELLVNEAMKIERTRHLRADPFERTDDRTDMANGFKPKLYKSRLGPLQLRIPQTRNTSFYPTVIEKGIRSDRALISTIAEMYVTGVSTRKVTKILEELCDFEVSSSTVSRINQTLDPHLNAWRNRPLGKFSKVMIDARYEKCRYGGSVQDAALLFAIGFTDDGRREILGVSTDISEAEIHWKTFLLSLTERGLHGVLHRFRCPRGPKKGPPIGFPGGHLESLPRSSR